MERSREDNTVSVVQRAVRHFRIPVTKNSVKEALLSHPYYPTFKSICDTFNEWKVENYPLKYQPEEMEKISAPYVVHFKNGGGQIAFVSEIGNDKVTYYEEYNTKREIRFKDFIERCSGAVILLNPDENSGEKYYYKKWQEEVISNSVLPVIAIVLFLYIGLTLFYAFNSDGYMAESGLGLLFLTKVLGIVLTTLLVLHDYEISLSFTDKLCHLNKSTNCNTVLNDKASKIFGWFGWADAGFIYFIGGLLILLQVFRGYNYSLFAIMSLLSLPYPIFSVYYQGFVLKKWCPLCLVVQIVLIVEFILLLPQFSSLHFSLSDISIFILTFLITAIIYILTNMYFREKMSNEKHNYKYLKFKKNPDVLRSLLLNQKHYEIPVTDSCLVFGEKESLLKITAFLSLHCSHCARAFEMIKNIVESESKIAINIILITSDNEILNTLYHFKQLNKNNEVLELLDRWYNMDPYSRSKISETLCIPEVDEVSKEVSNENNILFKECDVIGTPTFFINGYQLPNQYDIDDIKYFSEVFIRNKEVIA